MNTNTHTMLAAALVLIVAAGSAAASETEGQQLPEKSRLTRSEVTAEWQRAERAGETSRNAASFKSGAAAQTSSIDTGPSRKQVLADVARSRQDGSYVNADQAYGTPVPASSPRRAAGPRAPAQAARKGAHQRSE